MPISVNSRVQLLCQTFSSLRRGRESFRAFAGPVALTQDRVWHTENARGAVLSSADSQQTASTRPLQEQLREHMDLHQLQREPVPEDISDGDSAPAQKASKAEKRNANSTKVDKAPARKRDPSNKRSKRRSLKQSEQPKTVSKSATRAGRSVQARDDQQPQDQKPEAKPQRTLTKQEDIALCSAIKVSVLDLHTVRRQHIFPAAYSSLTQAIHCTFRSCV